MKYIELQDGEKVIVDDRDYDRVSKHTWYKCYQGNTLYILATINGKEKRLTTFIKEGVTQIKHGNDFRRSNLHDGDITKFNRAHKNSKSKYKGVGWDKSREKWVVGIYTDGKRKYLGRYADEEEAGRAYNKAVDDYWDGIGFKNVIGEDNRVEGKTYTTGKNQVKRRPGKSGFKGVHESEGYIFASVSSGYKNYNIGYFDTKEKAALAYNKVVLHFYGEDAILNNVPMTDELIEFVEGYKIPDRVCNISKAS